MKSDIQVEYRTRGPFNRIIIVIYGDKDQVALRRSKALGGRLKESLPKGSIVQGLEFSGYDRVRGQYYYTLTVSMGPDKERTKAVVDRCASNLVLLD